MGMKDRVEAGRYLLIENDPKADSTYSLTVNREITIGFDEVAEMDGGGFQLFDEHGNYIVHVAHMVNDEIADMLSKLANLSDVSSE